MHSVINITHPDVDWLILTTLHAGRNATEAFEDIGHSPDARELQQQYLIGETAEPAEKSVQVRSYIGHTHNTPKEDGKVIYRIVL